MIFLGKKRSRVLKNLKPYSYFPSRKRDYYFKTMAYAYVYDKTLVPIASKWLSSSNSNISLLLRFSIYKNKSKYPEILRSYERPVLLIYGSHDIVPLADAIENLSYFANGKLVILEDCGHFAMLDQPVQYGNTIVSFLKGE